MIDCSSLCGFPQVGVHECTVGFFTKNIAKLQQVDDKYGI